MAIFFNRGKLGIVSAVLAGDVLKSPEGDWSGLPAWLYEAYQCGRISFQPGIVEVMQSDGPAHIGPDGWIVRDGANELSVWDAESFSATYTSDAPAFYRAEMPVTPFAAGDVVELKSGSFPMVLLHEKPRLTDDPCTWWCVCWDVNGPGGRSARLMTRLLPAVALKRHVPFDQRDDDLPF